MGCHCENRGVREAHDIEPHIANVPRNEDSGAAGQRGFIPPWVAPFSNARTLRGSGGSPINSQERRRSTCAICLGGLASGRSRRAAATPGRRHRPPAVTSGADRRAVRPAPLGIRALLGSTARGSLSDAPPARAIRRWHSLLGDHPPDTFDQRASRGKFARDERRTPSAPPYSTSRRRSASRWPASDRAAEEALVGEIGRTSRLNSTFVGNGTSASARLAERATSDRKHFHDDTEDRRRNKSDLRPQRTLLSRWSKGDNATVIDAPTSAGKHDPKQ